MTKKPTNPMKESLPVLPSQEADATKPKHGNTGFDTPSATTESYETLVKKRKRKRSKNKSLLKKTLVVIAIFFAVVLATGLVAVSMLHFGKNNMLQAAENLDVEDGAVTYDEGKTVTYDGHTYELNENIVSICLIGYDQSSSDAENNKNGQADTVMVLALDTETGKTTVISIPRNSMVEAGIYAGDAFITEDSMQLCLAYSYGTDASTGSEYTTDIAQRILYNMPISYYFTLNVSGVGALADAIGGVSLTPIETIPGTRIYSGEPTVLFGKLAQSYVQYRDTENIDSPLDRQSRQIQFVQEYARQALTLSKSDASIFINLVSTVSQYSTTNLGASEITYLASRLLQNGITDITTISLQGEMTSDGYLGEYYLDKQSVYQTVLDVYYDEID